jgi:hypothetical protein
MFRAKAWAKKVKLEIRGLPQDQGAFLAADVIENSMELEFMYPLLLLESIKGWGPGESNATCLAVGVDHRRPIRLLSLEQREALAGLIRESVS